MAIKYTQMERQVLDRMLGRLRATIELLEESIESGEIRFMCRAIEELYRASSPDGPVMRITQISMFPHLDPQEVALSMLPDVMDPRAGNDEFSQRLQAKQAVWLAQRVVDGSGPNG